MEIVPSPCCFGQSILTTMRLAFFCGSLEPGRDGVGDYSRRLAGECVRQGHSCVIVALNDPCLSDIQRGSQEIEDCRIPVLRLPAGLGWSQRMVQARYWIGAFNPDWASLQFVPFAFHRKGLCFGLGKSIAEISAAASWHVMFHELWLGLAERAPFKDRAYGALQRRILLDVMGRLQPRLLHTHAEPYRRVLQRENIKTAILPLFSNIPCAGGDGWDGLLEPMVRKATGKIHERTDLYLAGVLGGVHPEWNAEQAVQVLLPLVHRFQKRLVLVLLGKSNLTPVSVNRLRSRLQSQAFLVVTGERTGVEVSRILQSLDIGLAASSRQLIQKSGSVAAMIEHGLTVLVTRDDWRLREPSPPPDETFPHLLSSRQFAMLETLPTRHPQAPDGNQVRRVASQLLESLLNSQTSNLKPEISSLKFQIPCVS
jgi:hypothetical protein